MAFIERFLGKRVEFPEDRVYDSRQHLWAIQKGDDLVFGLTAPGLLLMGGLKDLDWLAAEGESIHAGQEVVFAITGKILYLHSPVSGRIHFNDAVKAWLGLVSEDPYEKGWIFRVEGRGSAEEPIRNLVDFRAYGELLKGTEGCRNPEGVKGGVSGICKAVYSGIHEQELKKG
jgi:glycine cleavage system H lipoate-binding protein